MPNVPQSSTKVTKGVFALIATVSSVALFPSLNKSIWRDEGASLYSARLSWHALWQQSKVVDGVLLPYYSLLHLWIRVSGNIEWIRFPSLLAFGITIFLVGWIGNRFGGLWCGVIAAALAATNPLMIEAALNARPYALSVLAATLSIMALVQWFEGRGSRWMWWFCLASFFALILQMFSILSSLSVLMLVLVLRRQTLRNQWRTLIVPIGLLLAATIAFATLLAGQRGQVAWILPLDVKQLVIAMVGPASGDPLIGKQSVYAIVVLLVAIVALTRCVGAWRRGSLRFARLYLHCFAISLAWAALPTFELVLISLVKPIYVDRYVTASVPGMALATGLLTSHALGQTHLRKSVGPRTPFAVASLSAALIVLVADAAIVSTGVFENIQGATQYLANDVGKNGEIALPDHSLTAGVGYYLGVNHEVAKSWPQLTHQLFIDGMDLRQDSKTFSSAPDNIWLVDDGSVHGTGIFVKALEHNGFVRYHTEHFGGSHTIWIVHFRRSVN